MNRLLFNIGLAVEGVLVNKLRSFLTALGIIFGVAAVIAMLAIGSGAKEAILNQLKLIGSNSIVIEKKEAEKNKTDAQDSSTDTSEKDSKKRWSRGLHVSDVEAILRQIPTITDVSPEIIIESKIIADGRQGDIRVIGIAADYFKLNNLDIGFGQPFSFYHLQEGLPVCIIGRTIQTKYFQQKNPIGEVIKCGNVRLRVIGVLEKRIASKDNLDDLGIRDVNSDVYIPIQTALSRFTNRSKVTVADIGNRGRNSEETEYHQLDRLVVQIDHTENLQATADVLGRMLKRRHQGVVDFEIQIPELLLQQQQKTQETFNLVLAVIAGISLLVGGIGIMNIMLASVLERIKEIGVRRSMGAQQNDIINQFLFEAIIISLIGGLIGVALGIGAAKIIASYAEIPTVVSAWSIVISFGVAFIVGLIFGLFPAQRAAAQDPIKALRVE